MKLLVAFLGSCFLALSSFAQTAGPTRTATRTPTVLITPTHTATPSRTPTKTPPPTATYTPLPTRTSTGTPAATATRAAMVTATATAAQAQALLANTSTPTSTPTRTSTPTPTGSPSIAPLPSVSGESAGIIGGKFTVKPSGAASYQIPLSVPPGTGKIAPQLSLEYDSSAGDGTTGRGWTLSGLSVISRCPANPGSDGYLQPVNFNQNDRFCLDGTGLVLTSGVFGANNSEYSTAPETFTRIQAVGASGNGPQSFIAQRKDGLILYFGSTSDSRREINSRGDIISWYLSRIEDRNGNYLQVWYDKDVTQGRLLPLWIDYTGNDSAGLTPYNKVYFEYESSALPTSSYIAGAYISSAKRLRRVIMYANQAPVWTYTLSYETKALSERLIELQECEQQAGTCFSTKFAWGAEDPADVTFGAPASFPATGRTGGALSGWYYPSITGDWNGDGKSDVGWITPNGTNDSTVNLYISSNGSIVPYASVSLGRKYIDSQVNPILVGDWNGDGRSDIGVARNCAIDLWSSTGQGLVALNPVPLPPNGSGCYFRDTNATPIFTGDWNGDGKIDFALLVEKQLVLYVADASMQYQNPPPVYTIVDDRSTDSLQTPIIIGDWNGDSLTDFASLGTGGIQFYASTGTWFAPLFWVPNFSKGQGYTNTNVYPIVTGDWNGDGLTDFARASDSGVTFCDSTGTGLTNCRNLTDFAPSLGYTSNDSFPIFTGDWNGDGITDIGRVTQDGFRTYLIKSPGFYGPYNTALFGRNPYTDRISYPLVVGDWNGDGFTDIGRFSDGQIAFVNHAASQTDLMLKITDNLGATTDITYAPLTSGIYNKGTTAAYPINDVTGSTKVVASVAMNNGLGGKSRINYNYKGLKYDQVRHALLGFEKVNSVDAQTGITTITLYRQDGNFISLPYLVEQKLANGTTISRKEDTWASTAAPANNYFTYISQTSLSTFDPNGNLISSSASNNTYDSYGNITQTVTTNSDGSKETTVTTYNNDTTAWLIGQITQVSVTKSAAGDLSPATRTSAFSYLPSGLISSETIEPGNSTLRLIKTYSYDSFGNILSTAISGPGITTRSSSSKYDARGQFATEITDPLGNTQLVQYDPKNGLPIRIQDPNGLVTTNTYDGFGRLTYSVAPDGVPSRKLSLKAVNIPLSNAAYYIRTDTSGSAASIVYYDEVSREIRKETTGFNGRKIFIDQIYDDRGQLSLVSEPYFENDTPVWTSIEYDAIGRVIKSNAPGNRITTNTYNGLTTTVTNPLGQTKTQTTDCSSHPLSVTDNAGSVTTYKYDGYGNILEIKDPLGNTITYQYDVRGNKTRVSDPDTHVSTYVYDALGQLTSQTDGANRTTTMTYDLLGRLTQRTAPGSVSTFTYDTALNGKGKLAQATGPSGYVETYFYDSLSRPTKVNRLIGSTTFGMSTTYDQYSRPSTITYPDLFTIKNIYAANGELSNVVRASDNQSFWRANFKNAAGQITSRIFGNGLEGQSFFDPNTSLVQTIRTGTVQDLRFTFDALGNLTQRRDLRVAATENFTYDNLNRLIKAQVVGKTAVQMTYDKIGNILTRSDAGTYVYGGNNAGPHAVTSITGAKPNQYTYDAVGNRISSSNGTIIYNASGQPTRVRSGNLDFKIGLDANGNRVFEWNIVSGVLQDTKAIIDTLFEQFTTSSGYVKKTHYIPSTDGLVAAYIADNTGSSKTLYLHKDHLGSIQTITNELGNVVEVSSFDSWGTRRNPTTWAPLASEPVSELDRGFTGHEHLSDFGLIHMNGRIYDPSIGRFVSADPFIQQPYNLQALNSYSYVNNNPLSFTDPSGFFLSGLKRIFRRVLPVIAAIVFAIQPQLIAPYLATTFSFSPLVSNVVAIAISTTVSNLASSITGAVTSGGSFSDGFKAGIHSAPMSALRNIATFGVGEGFDAGIGDGKAGLFKELFNGYAEDAKIIAHGLSNGAFDSISGGRFLEGFVSGSAGEVGAKYSGSYGVYGAAISGGTASALAGGKFEDGAIKGAFVYLYNTELHQKSALEGNLEVLNNLFLIRRGLDNTTGLFGDLAFEQYEEIRNDWMANKWEEDLKKLSTDRFKKEYFEHKPKIGLSPDKANMLGLFKIVSAIENVKYPKFVFYSANTLMLGEAAKAVDYQIDAQIDYIVRNVNNGKLH